LQFARYVRLFARLGRVRRYRGIRFGQQREARLFGLGRLAIPSLTLGKLARQRFPLALRRFGSFTPLSLLLLAFLLTFGEFLGQAKALALLAFSDLAGQALPCKPLALRVFAQHPLLFLPHTLPLGGFARETLAFDTLRLQTLLLRLLMRGGFAGETFAFAPRRF